jgi:competence protein ComGC
MELGPMGPTTPNPGNLTPGTGSAFVECIRRGRLRVALWSGLASLVLLVFSAFFAYKLFESPPGSDRPAAKPLNSNPLDPDIPPELPKPASDRSNFNKGDFIVGLAACLLACLGTGATSLWLMARTPPPSADEQRTEARAGILAAGISVGFIAILTGLILFYRWSESISAWLDKGQEKESRWVLIPLLILTLGAAVAFLAIRPARADERKNTSIRKLVHGSNFGFTILLMICAIAIVNVLISLKVPNKLDTTATDFYSIGDNTTQLLVRLDAPVTAYAVLPDSDERPIADVRQFLRTCQDSSAGKFIVKFVSTSTNKNELNLLMSKYPKLELTMSDRRQGRFGAVVLATGPDEKRAEVIPVPEFFTTQDRQSVFVGERKVFKELTVLSDWMKPVVYFTQSNGELAIPASNGHGDESEPEVQAPDDRKATRLKTYLKKNYLDVQALTLSGASPTVPENAAMVVIAGPRIPFNEQQVGALRKYLTSSHGTNGKKGKLIVLTGAVPGPNSKGVQKTGLEALLGDYNVSLGEKIIYTVPNDQHPYPLIGLSKFTNAAMTARQPIAEVIEKAVRVIPMNYPREVAALQKNPTYRATALLDSAFATWIEDNRLDRDELNKTFRELLQNEKLQVAKSLSGPGRPFGVVVSEGISPRLAVYGSDEFVSDEEAKDFGADNAPFSFDLMGVTIDWLRERQSISEVGIEAKRYFTYSFPDPAGLDFTRLLYLPLGLGGLIIAGLGVGVWVRRRK